MKEIIISKFFITVVKGLGKTRITALHHLLNTGIFHNIHKLWRNLYVYCPILVRGVKSVSHLMPHQEIVYGVACLLPHRKREHTGVNVELSSLHLLVLNHQIFCGKQLGKLRFDLVANGHGFVAYERIIQKKRVVRPSSVPV